MAWVTQRPMPNQTLLKGRARPLLHLHHLILILCDHFLLECYRLNARGKLQLALFSFPLHPHTAMDNKAKQLPGCRNHSPSRLGSSSWTSPLLRDRVCHLHPHTWTLWVCFHCAKPQCSWRAPHVKFTGLNNGYIPQICLGSYKKHSLNWKIHSWKEHFFYAECNASMQWATTETDIWVK